MDREKQRERERDRERERERVCVRERNEMQRMCNNYRCPGQPNWSAPAT